MTSIGLPIEWLETGRNKGKKYQMVRPGQEPTSQESNLDKASEQIRRFKIREVMQVFEESSVTSLKFGQLRNLVASRLGITRKEAGAVIEDMLEEEQLHDADRKEGSRIISLDKPTQASSSAQEPSKEKQLRDTKEKPTSYDPMEDHELDMATNVLDLLAEPSRHFQQGETVKKLHELVGGEMGLRTFRDVLSKLEVRGLIKRDNRGNYGRARKGMLIKLAGQRIKEEWNLDKKAFLETVRPAVDKNKT